MARLARRVGLGRSVPREPLVIRARLVLLDCLDREVFLVLMEPREVVVTWDHLVLREAPENKVNVDSKVLLDLQDLQEKLAVLVTRDLLELSVRLEPQE